MMTRRNLTQALAGAALTTALPHSSGGSRKAAAAPGAAFPALLGRTVPAEFSYDVDVEGDFPGGLNGVLYRNGPGRFDRGGYRKQNLLDGDGMVQRYAIRHGAVHFSNRFVRTPKFLAEEAAGRLLHPTWTTRAPGGFPANLGAEIPSQAGVTVYDVNGHILALDEVGLPYEVDGDTLETKGTFPIGSDKGKAVRKGDVAIKAHAKYDARARHWIFVGNSYGRRMKLTLIIQDAAGRLIRERRFTVPDNIYIHDFFATERYVIILLHPMVFSPFPFLAGLKSFTDSLHWQPAQGNRIMIVERAGNAPPRFFDADAAFMWHALNAYERGDEIVADFVGYDAPDHFIGSDPAFAAIMEGRVTMPKHRGRLRRYIIDPQTRRVREETLADANVEFPMIRTDLACRRHRFGYVTVSAGSTIFHDGVARIDTETGQVRKYHFGEGIHAGEPIFAPKPGASDNPADADAGWLLTVGLDGNTGSSFLAIFDAENVSAGPLAIARLTHHLPLSFHGCWVTRT